MNILYLFPHPDDESFGPAIAIAQQRRLGHDVHLVTLTRGGATKQRFRLGLSVEEMGEVRYREMLDVERELDLSSMVVLDLPDSGLKEMDPRDIERVVAGHIERIRPDVVVTYAVFGVSGFPDHLVIHGVVKRVVLEMRDNGADYLRRLALFTVDASNPRLGESIHNIRGSKQEDIDCVIIGAPEDVGAMRRALGCYRTYQETINSSNVVDVVGNSACFELFQEQFDPPLNDLFAQLPGAA
jgi:LmbE family N-acetylglucosaminyl deacetylase